MNTQPATTRFYLFLHGKPVARLSQGVYRGLIAGQLRLAESGVTELRVLEVSFRPGTAEVTGARGYSYRFNAAGRVDLGLFAEPLEQLTKAPAKTDKIIDLAPKLRHREWQRAVFWTPTTAQIAEIAADLRSRGGNVPLVKLSRKTDVIKIASK